MWRGFCGRQSESKRNVLPHQQEGLSPGRMAWTQRKWIGRQWDARNVWPSASGGASSSAADSAALCCAGQTAILPKSSRRAAKLECSCARSTQRLALAPAGAIGGVRVLVEARGSFERGDAEGLDMLVSPARRPRRLHHPTVRALRGEAPRPRSRPPTPPPPPSGWVEPSARRGRNAGSGRSRCRAGREARNQNPRVERVRYENCPHQRFQGPRRSTTRALDRIEPRKGWSPER